MYANVDGKWEEPCDQPKKRLRPAFHVAGVIVCIAVGCFLLAGCADDTGWGSMVRVSGYQVDVYGGIGVIISPNSNSVDKGPNGLSFNGRLLSLRAKRGVWAVSAGQEAKLLTTLTSRQMTKLKEYMLERTGANAHSMDELLQLMKLSQAEVDAALDRSGETQR
jgi:hypothetical protein